MEDKKSLSDKIHVGMDEIDLPPYIDKEDVREAVKKLKEIFERSKNKNKYIKEIDKIFGEKLTK